jgi:hypothetical protein
MEYQSPKLLSKRIILVCLLGILCISLLWLALRLMVFNTNFNNISIIWWWSVLLVEETGVSCWIQMKMNRGLIRVYLIRPVCCIILNIFYCHNIKQIFAASQWQNLSHNVVSSTPHLSSIRTHNVRDDWHWLHRLL